MMYNVRQEEGLRGLCTMYNVLCGLAFEGILNIHRTSYIIHCTSKSHLKCRNNNNN